MSQPSPIKTALVVVDHGSRNADSNASLDEAVSRMAELAGDRYLVVLPAHMEIARPSIGEAVDAAVAAGAEQVVVALYFLARGRHSQSDVPRLVAEAASRHHGVRFAITEPLGPDASLNALVLERAANAKPIDQD